MDDDRDKAMLLILNFFRNKMAAVNKHNVNQVKEILSNHRISVGELVDRYIKFVYENS